MSNRLLTTEGVEERYGIPVRTLRELRYRGTGPAYLHIGRRVMYREQDVDQFINDAVRSAAKR